MYDPVQEIVRQALPSGALAHRADYFTARGEPTRRFYSEQVDVQELGANDVPLGPSRRLSRLEYECAYRGLKPRPSETPPEDLSPARRGYG
jgi:hypothetical protein